METIIENSYKYISVVDYMKKIGYSNPYVAANQLLKRHGTILNNWILRKKTKTAQNKIIERVFILNDKIDLINALSGKIVDVKYLHKTHTEYINILKNIYMEFNPIIEYKENKYRYDLYLKEIDTVIECDQDNHNGYNKGDEKAREIFIIKNHKYLIRFNPYQKEFCIGNLIREINYIVFHNDIINDLLEFDWLYLIIDSSKKVKEITNKKELT